MIDQVKIYVFGSCHFNNRLDNDDAVGNGGFGVVISVNGKVVEEFSGGFSSTTNARMDILGITEGIKRIKEPSDIIVYSPSGYVVDTLTKGWLESWKKTGFKKKKHVDLWKNLDAVLQETPHLISFLHCKDVKNSPEFQKAEKLGKAMSVTKNLPFDLVNENTGAIDIFNTQLKEEVEDEVLNSRPVPDAVCVDASCIDNPGKMEYRGIDLKTGKVIFERKYKEATNNIGEFLAIVHALALFKKEGKDLKVVYSDSQNAISWVNQKKCRTKLEVNENNADVFEHIERAVIWLNNNEYDTQVLKWNTALWGEIPADYGRK